MLLGPQRCPEIDFHFLKLRYLLYISDEFHDYVFAQLRTLFQREFPLSLETLLNSRLLYPFSDPVPGLPSIRVEVILVVLTLLSIDFYRSAYNHFEALQLYFFFQLFDGGVRFEYSLFRPILKSIAYFLYRSFTVLLQTNVQ